MDAFLPGVAGWELAYDNPNFWHFRFNGPTPEALVAGREKIYFAYFWDDLAADRTRSLPVADREAYVAAYSRPRRMRAGWAYFAAWPDTARDFAQLAQTKLTMPVLSIAGEKASAAILSSQMKLVATNVTVNEMKDTLADGRATQGNHGRPACISMRWTTLDWSVRKSSRKSRCFTKTLFCIAIVTWSLLSAAVAQAVPEMRITPTEVMRDKGDSRIGSLKLAGVHTKVLSGNPAAAGFYSILLFVPAHTTIQAHSHRDDRMASVISGNWQL